MKRILTNLLRTAALTAAVFGMGCRSEVPTTPAEPIQAALPVESSKTEPRPAAVSPISADVFLDVARFQGSDAVAATDLIGQPIAGVVNHHALASDLLSNFFESLCTARPDLKRIMLLSPDHYHQGADSVSVGAFPYVSQGERVDIDTGVLDALREHGVAVGSRRIFEHEHGIGALVPFLVRSCGDISLVPILVRADATSERLDSVAEILAPFIDTHTVIVVSADMSHYLPEDVALKNDATTERWFGERNARELLRATDDFTDNGRSFVLLFDIFERLGIEPAFQNLGHSISSNYGGDRAYTTSYITGTWNIRK